MGEAVKIILCYTEFQATLSPRPKKNIFQMNEALEAVGTYSGFKCRASNGCGLTRKQAEQDLRIFKRSEEHHFPRRVVGLEMAPFTPTPHPCDPLSLGPRDPIDFPRLPDPQALFPNRRRPLEFPGRPTTLTFAPRPRPAASRPRLDPWKLVSFGRTLSISPPSRPDTPESPGPPSVQPTLLDMDMEGQSQDNTVPLCGAYGSH